MDSPIKLFVTRTQNVMYKPPNYMLSPKTSKVHTSGSKIKIIGLLTSKDFQKARLCASKLHECSPYRFLQPEINEMLDVEWKEKYEEIRRYIGGKTWTWKRPEVAVFIDEKLIGNYVDFIRHIGTSYTLYPPINSDNLKTLIAQRYRNLIEKTGQTCVYFLFAINGNVIGSVRILLYSDSLPRTCQTFFNLCTGNYKNESSLESSMSYKTCKVVRIVKNTWLEIGEPNREELTKESVTLSDESYCIPHDRRGVLSMASSRKNCNIKKLIISLKRNEWMNRLYVAFGQVIDGDETLRIIENVATHRQVPLSPITIADCGQFSFENKIIFDEAFAYQEKRKNAEKEEEGNDSETLLQDRSKCPSDERLYERDAASLFMLERFEEGAYSLWNDYSLDQTKS